MTQRQLVGMEFLDSRAVEAIDLHLPNVRLWVEDRFEGGDVALGGFRSLLESAWDVANAALEDTPASGSLSEIVRGFSDVLRQAMSSLQWMDAPYPADLFRWADARRSPTRIAPLQSSGERPQLRFELTYQSRSPVRERTRGRPRG